MLQWLLTCYCGRLVCSPSPREQSVFRGFRLRNRIHRVVAKLQLAAALQIQSLIRGIQARERVCILRFERKAERRRRAGEPLQFTLPSRARTSAVVSSLRPLYEHRKSRARLEFGSASWHDEQLCLRLHKVVTKLCANQELLQRRMLAEMFVTPKRQRRPRALSGRATRSPSSRRREQLVVGVSSPVVVASGMSFSQRLGSVGSVGSVGSSSSTRVSGSPVRASVSGR